MDREHREKQLRCENQKPSAIHHAARGWELQATDINKGKKSKSEAISDSSRHPRVGASGNWHQQGEREQIRSHQRHPKGGSFRQLTLTRGKRADNTLMSNPVCWYDICALPYKAVQKASQLFVVLYNHILSHSCAVPDMDSYTYLYICTYQPVTGGALATLLWF